MIKEFARKEKDKASAFASNLRSVFFSIVKAVGFITLLYSIEYVATQIWSTNFGVIPDWVIRIQVQIPNPSYPDDRDVIIELISVIASISGVILALFYPILATIASTAYAKVHRSIRNLLLNEEVTQTYLRQLTFLTASTITVLLFMTFHYLPGTLVLSVIFFYAIFTLFRILRIGIGVYIFFDPSTLSKTAVNRLIEAVRNVTTDGPHYSDRNFQKHFYRIAFNQSENLSLLMSLCLESKNTQSTAITSIFQAIIISLRFYLINKVKIPITSLWFPTMNIHQSFFESDMTLRNLSQSTSTFIQPKVERDENWLEKKLVADICTGFKDLVDHNKKGIVGESILLTYSLLDEIGNLVDLKTGELLLNDIHVLLGSMSTKIEVGTEDFDYEKWRDEMGCVESYCYAVLRLQVGVLAVAAKFDSIAFENEYSKIDWKAEDTIYSTSFIPELTESLNKYLAFLDNEKEFEGVRITPDWYILQSLASEYLSYITRKIHSAITLFEKLILSIIDKYDTNKNALLASFTAQIGLAIIHKLRYRLGEVKQSLNDFDKLEICKGEFDWRKPNFENIDKELDEYSVNCIMVISDNFEPLASVNWNNLYPDVFAHSYSILSLKLNECFANDDSETFETIFPKFLGSSLRANEKLNERFNEFDDPFQFSYQTLIDPMELSGYAYLYSIVYQKEEYWKCVKKTWNNTFSATKESIELFVRYYAYYSDYLRGSGLNWPEKHRRELTFKDVITKLGVSQDDIDDLVAKEFITGSYYPSLYNVAEIFLELYLFTFIEAKDAASGARRELFDRVCSVIEFKS